MTPRSLLTVIAASQISEAPRLAEDGDFEVIPVVRDGRIRDFWRRKTRRVCPITKSHWVQYSAPVVAVMPRLAERVAQFVCYGEEVVGIVDLSDLNKPKARLIWLQPLLELEQHIFLAARAMRVSDDDVRRVLGSAAREAEGKRRKAQKEDLGFPLLEFLQFPQVLKVGRELGIVSLAAEEADRLNVVRRRSAHGVARPVEKASDGKELVSVLAICERLLTGSRSKPPERVP
jgi:hypothetical protein